MAQNSSTKIVSLHMERCKNLYCKHRSICYHNNKNIKEHLFTLGLTERILMLKKGWYIFESICNTRINNLNWHLLKFYKNYNITIPACAYEPCLDRVKNQIQITITDEEQAEIFKDYQKLFLIKDDISWRFFLQNIKLEKIHNIHYIFEQKYITKEKLRIASKYKMLDSSLNTSLDSCFTSFILNGRCPYSYGNYIDLTFDGTIRYCPYSRSGNSINYTQINNSSDMVRKIEELFEIKLTPRNCIYSKLFGGLLDVHKHSTSV